MDEYIISQIVPYLSEKDLTSFSMINKQTYNYCTHTNVYNKKCNINHITYHYTLSLLENAKLSYCMNLLKFVKGLYDSEISRQKYAIHLSLQRRCGTIIKLVFGRDIVINSMIYSFNTIISLCDLQKENNSSEIKLFKINNVTNMERLKHKVNSIISNRYTGYEIKIINNVIGDYYTSFVDEFKNNIDKYFIKLLNII